MFKNIFKKDKLKNIKKVTDKVISLEGKISLLSDSELTAKIADFKARIANNESIENITPEIFAVCREASFRVLNMKHFPVQIMGASVLNDGNIAEMKTGEGKTLVVTLAAYLNAVLGSKVHVITVNGYLAHRDKEWMGRLFNFLGLTVGLVYSGQTKEEKKVAYACDIVYGTNSEFGFDYLRDNMVHSKEQKIQGALDYAIIDEVDSVLIDDARIPLIITSPNIDSAEIYELTEIFIKNLKKEDYDFEEKEKTIYLTESGVNKAEEYFELDNLADIKNTTINHHINISLRAHFYMKANIDYIIKDERIVLVEKTTGRLSPTKMYADGLHQAIEAKEGLIITGESTTEATITYQNFFKLYKKLSGMTGTAMTEKEELLFIYNLDVISIPTNKPVIRVDHNDIVYRTNEEKFNAIVTMVKEKHSKGQPILLGTADIKNSEHLSMLLSKENLSHTVLNAKNHEIEAQIIASAGEPGAITVATNMAGRGTDILLGGNPSFTKEEAAELGITELTEENKNILKDHAKAKAQATEILKVRAIENGGLCVIGTQRHESRRIDHQLRGRAGRQGDPGESVFFLSLEDDLLRLFGGDKIMNMADSLKLNENTPISANMLTNIVERSQKKIESVHYQSRKRLVEYDTVLSRQREMIYSDRDKVLELSYDELITLINQKTKNILDDLILENTEEDYCDFKRVKTIFSNKYIDLPSSELDEIKNSDELLDITAYKVKSLYSNEDSDRLIKSIYLEAIDKYFRRYICDIEAVKHGIGLRGTAGHNPVTAFYDEAFELYDLMLDDINKSFIKTIMKNPLPQRAGEESQVPCKVESL